jgi:uncharacterized repeat protein (TIGR03803 family)
MAAEGRNQAVDARHSPVGQWLRSTRRFVDEGMKTVVNRLSARRVLRLALLTVASSAVANAQSYTDLYDFDYVHGAAPEYPALLAQGRDGNLYGTTSLGGSQGSGVGFKITPTGTLTRLYSFCTQTNCADGLAPWSGMTLGTKGNFYGSTIASGENGGGGTIFEGIPGVGLSTLYTFTSGTDVFAPPIEGIDANFYGTTAASDGSAVGTAYRVTLSGNFISLGSIPGASYAPLLQATDGDFYGTTFNGGAYDGGTVFKMTPAGAVKTLWDFDDGHVYAPLIEGGDGNFYGTTQTGGAYKEGVVFKLTPEGVTVLHNFGDPNYPSDGGEPSAGLIQATDGNFYGVTDGGGTLGYGIIFQISPTGAYSILHNFDFSSGAIPASTPMQHTNGTIYGLASQGGTFRNCGVVYSFDLGLPPFVALAARAGKVGQTGGILGQGFSGATSVLFNGTSAPFTVVSDTYLTATVPPGATTGFITVATPSGTLTSNQKFQVRP